MIRWISRRYLRFALPVDIWVYADTVQQQQRQRVRGWKLCDDEDEALGKDNWLFSNDSESETKKKKSFVFCDNIDAFTATQGEDANITATV